MANFKSLEMASAVSAHPHIVVKKSLFGLCKTAVYEPSQSPLEVSTFEYVPDAGEQLVKLVNLPVSQFVAEMQRQRPATAPIGHVRLELCMSRDRRFVALQVFRFVDFGYAQATDLKVFEEADAAAVAQLF